METPSTSSECLKKFSSTSLGIFIQLVQIKNYLLLDGFKNKTNNNCYWDLVDCAAIVS